MVMVHGWLPQPRHESRGLRAQNDLKGFILDQEKRIGLTLDLS